MMDDLGTFFHNLRGVLSRKRRRLIVLAITEVMAVGLIWLLTASTRYAVAAGQREVAGFWSGVAFCVIVVAALEFVLVIGRTIHEANLTMPYPITAAAGPWPSVDGEDQPR